MLQVRKITDFSTCVHWMPATIAAPIGNRTPAKIPCRCALGFPEAVNRPKFCLTCGAHSEAEPIG